MELPLSSVPDPRLPPWILTRYVQMFESSVTRLFGMMICWVGFDHRSCALPIRYFTLGLVDTRQPFVPTCLEQLRSMICISSPLLTTRCCSWQIIQRLLSAPLCSMSI